MLDALNARGVYGATNLEATPKQFDVSAIIVAK